MIFTSKVCHNFDIGRHLVSNTSEFVSDVYGLNFSRFSLQRFFLINWLFNNEKTLVSQRIAQKIEPVNIGNKFRGFTHRMTTYIKIMAPC